MSSIRSLLRLRSFCKKFSKTKLTKLLLKLHKLSLHPVNTQTTETPRDGSRICHAVGTTEPSKRIQEGLFFS